MTVLTGSSAFAFADDDDAMVQPCDCAPAIAARTRLAVTGVSNTAAPRGRSASLTALTIAAGGPIAPFSPMPFMPNMENGDGVSMKSSLTSGIDGAVGTV